MRFERTVDFELVRRILTHPDLYSRMGDDGSPPREQFRPNPHPDIWYVLAIEYECPAGLFVLVPENVITWQIHVAMLPWAWGAIAQLAGRSILPWVWEHTPCRRITASVLAGNRLAVQYGLRTLGLVQFGRDPQSFLKNGQRQDRILMGRSHLCPV